MTLQIFKYVAKLRESVIAYIATFALNTAVKIYLQRVSRSATSTSRVTTHSFDRNACEWQQASAPADDVTAIHNITPLTLTTQGVRW